MMETPTPGNSNKCSNPQCSDGYIPGVRDGYDIVYRCRECAINKRLKWLVKQMGERRRIPIMEPERIPKDHAITLACDAAINNIEISSNENPIGGIFLYGSTGSGKTTAVSMLIGNIIRKWPDLHYEIYRHTYDLSNDMFRYSEMSDRLSKANLIVIDDFVKKEFASLSASDELVSLIHYIIDLADCGKALVVLASSARAEELQQWLRQDTARRIKNFSSYDYTFLGAKDCGCPWGSS